VRFADRQDQVADERVIGVLYLDSRQRGTLEPPAIATALETLSIEAALAIENAQLYREALVKAKYEEESRVAASIQAALLPAGSRAGRFFTAAAISVACHAVGGDFFDYVDLPSAGFGFILGDVSGKGSPAALLAAAALGMFSIEARRHARAAPVMSELNAGLFRRGIEARFITASYGILCPDGRLTYANAGHNPPILLTANGHRRLETGGLLLGLFEDAFVDEETLTLEPGHCVVVYSDGITEARNVAGEPFEETRLLESLDRHRGDAPADLVHALAADVRAFCGDAPQSDDLTVVAVRYDG
jgi:sigma-B regulation protein RsbU (phosphoserine phosphatase)